MSKPGMRNANAFGMSKIIPLLFLCFFSSSAYAQNTSTSKNPYGIGTISQSNQIEYERFEGAFYVAWNPLTLSHTNLRSDNDSYSTDLESAHMNGINLGVRHPIASFGKFALLGDYGVSVGWMKGNFKSDSTEISASSSSASVMSLGLSPALLLAYFYTDKIHPFFGLSSSFFYSRLQTPISGGDNEYFEFHYGPAVGIQIVNLPFQNIFFSAEWVQLLKQAQSAQRLYADNGHAEVALGLNF